ncbi:MAG: thiamine pyrophosphate-binding protein [Gammaproteobacteria bacterium]
MRGRQVFMDSLVAHGVDAIFGNPGTTENPLLDSLVDYPGIDYIVALHEGVAVGAANFYGQASGRPVVANLHVAPGLGNAVGMMYGALKACSPVVVTAGQQDTRMRLRDPILRHDLVAMAAPVSKWAVEVQHADEFGVIMRRAFKTALEPPAGPVFVALPIDVMEQETANGAQTAGVIYGATRPDPAGIERLAAALAASRNPAIVAGDEVAVSGANAALAALAERLGATVYSEFLRAQLSFAYRHANFRGRVPYTAGEIRELLAPHDLVLLLGGPFFEEVWFDAGAPLESGTIVAQIESAPSRLAYNFSLDLGLVAHLPAALEALNDALPAAQDAGQAEAARARQASLAAERDAMQERFAARVASARDTLPLAPALVLDTLGRRLPAGAILVDESITASAELTDAFDLDQPGDYHGERGGGIGQGVAGALGVAVANPARKVVALSGDGSAMYSIQALWTAAHHELDILFVVLSNREYRVLKHNMDAYRARFDAVSDKPYQNMDLSHPELGFSEMAAGMGVAGRRVETLDAFVEALDEAFAARGPRLVDVVVAGKD